MGIGWLLSGVGGIVSDFPVHAWALELDILRFVYALGITTSVLAALPAAVAAVAWMRRRMQARVQNPSPVTTNVPAELGEQQAA